MQRRKNPKPKRQKQWFEINPFIGLGCIVVVILFAIPLSIGLIAAMQDREKQNERNQVEEWRAERAEKKAALEEERRMLRQTEKRKIEREERELERDCLETLRRINREIERQAIEDRWKGN